MRPAFDFNKSREQYRVGAAQGVAYVTITVVLLCCAGIFGIYPILLLYSMWLPFLFYRAGSTRRIVPALYLPLAMGGFYICSSIWSDAPFVSAKASLEAASMIVCSIIIARVVRLEDFILGLNLGITLVLVAALIDGTYAFDFFSGTYSLIGIFSSKNQVGLCAEAGLLTSLLLFARKERFLKKLMLYTGPLLVSGVSLFLSRSATSVASLGLTLMFCGTLCCLTKIPRNFRMMGLILIVAIATVAIFGLFGLGAQEGLALFGKDSSLTGRTLLWSKGINFGMTSPVIGCGFGAFWIPGRPLAEEMWHMFGVNNRIGFHFHNSFVEAFVELGIAGLTLFFIMLAVVLISCIRSVFRNGMNIANLFGLIFSTTMIIRALVEVDAFGTFGIGELMLFVIAPYLSSHEKRCAEEAQTAHSLCRRTFSLQKPG